MSAMSPADEGNSSLLRAAADSAASMLLDVQQDCIALQRRVNAVEAVLNEPPSDDLDWLTDADFQSCTECNCAHCEADDQWCPMAVKALIERKVEDRDEQFAAALRAETTP